MQRCQTDCVFTCANFVWGKWSRIINKHKINCVLIREIHKKLLNQLHKLRLWLMHIWFFYGFKFGARLGGYLLLLLLLLLTLNLSCFQCMCAHSVSVYMLILLFLITYLMLLMLCAFKSLSKCNNCTWTHWLVWMNLGAPPCIITRSGSRAGCGALFIDNYWLFDVNQLLLLFNIPITHCTCWSVLCMSFAFPLLLLNYFLLVLFTRWISSSVRTNV